MSKLSCGDCSSTKCGCMVLARAIIHITQIKSPQSQYNCLKLPDHKSLSPPLLKQYCKFIYSIICLNNSPSPPRLERLASLAAPNCRSLWRQRIAKTLTALSTTPAPHTQAGPKRTIATLRCTSPLIWPFNTDSSSPSS